MTYEDDPYNWNGVRTYCGYIDRNGHWAIKPIFHKAEDFIDGAAIVAIDNKYGVIDSNGKYLIEPQDNIGIDPIRDKLFMIKDGVEHYIDKYGNTLPEEILQKKPSTIPDNDVKQEFEIFQEGKYTGVKDRDGRVIIKPIYHCISDNPKEGLFSVLFGEEKKFEDPLEQLFHSKDDMKWGLIDYRGKVVMQPTYGYLGCTHYDVDRLEFHDGMATVKVGDKWGYIDPTGRMAIEPQFGRAFHFEQGIAPVVVTIDEGTKRYGRYGIIDKTGKYVVNPMYSNISAHIEDGYLRVEIDGQDANFNGGLGPTGKWGIIDTKGNVVIEPQFEYIVPNGVDGIFRIQEGEKFGFVDCRSGKIIKPIFNFVWQFSEGLAAVRLTEDQLANGLPDPIN